MFARRLLVCPGITRHPPARTGRDPRRSPHGPAQTGIESTDLTAEQRAPNRGSGFKSLAAHPYMPSDLRKREGFPLPGLSLVNFSVNKVNRLLLAHGRIPQPQERCRSPGASPGRPRDQGRGGGTSGPRQSGRDRAAAGSRGRPGLHRRAARHTRGGAGGRSYQTGCPEPTGPGDARCAAASGSRPRRARRSDSGNETSCRSQRLGEMIVLTCM
jgi:hypothetical protein